MAITIHANTRQDELLNADAGYVLEAGATGPLKNAGGFLRDAVGRTVLDDAPAAPVVSGGFVKDGVGGPLAVSTAAVARTRGGFEVDASGYLVFASLV